MRSLRSIACVWRLSIGYKTTSMAPMSMLKARTLISPSIFMLGGTSGIVYQEIASHTCTNGRSPWSSVSRKSCEATRPAT